MSISAECMRSVGTGRSGDGFVDALRKSIRKEPTRPDGSDTADPEKSKP
jgi:hypothetical protein